MSSHDFSVFSASQADGVIHHSKNARFFFFKRLFDVVCCVLLLPVLAFSAIVLLILNPFMNKGKLIFVQTRMGQNCAPFQAYKFRTMSEEKATSRCPDSPLEVDRITPLGSKLRRLRIDELPQILNVLRGEMSMIGPRPDYFQYASQYIVSVPGYSDRHIIRPGISGLAQTQIGYVQSIAGTKLKVSADLEYIQNLGFFQELRIVWRTLVVICMRAGS
ncbi:sugar transferase [Planktotalea sp.]|uniref:sugar transferase n=1 Tax=Planktotalea sp. TaxID=2029877 RepID=UPI003D6AE4A0